MSVLSLPAEIIKKIFLYLQNEDLNRIARHVCRRWNKIGEEMNDSYWKARCQKDFPEEYEDAFRKTYLDWQELYHSLSLWPKVTEANIVCYETDTDVVSKFYSERDRHFRFYALKDEYIAVPTYCYESDRDRRLAGMLGHYNMIYYYTVDNMQPFLDRDFDFKFDRHYENDDIIVLRKTDGTIHIVVKGEEFIEDFGADVGKVGTHDWDDRNEFHVVKNDVYFMDSQRMLCVAKIYTEDEDGEPVRKVKAEEVLKPDFQELAFDTGFQGWVCHKIAAMTYISPNQVNILQDRGLIYSLKDNKLECITQVKKRMDNRTEVVKVLKQNGFDWANEDVYNNFLKTHDIIEGDWVAITRVKEAIIHRQGKLVLVATTFNRRTIHVYYNPFRMDGELKLYNAKPLLKIELSEILPVTNDRDDERYPYRLIEQMTIVESINGHRIVVLYANRLAVVQLDHGAPKRHPRVWRSNHYEKRRFFE